MDPTMLPARFSTLNRMSRIVTADLHKSFGEHPVLRGVELTVPGGTFAAAVLARRAAQALMQSARDHLVQVVAACLSF